MYQALNLFRKSNPPLLEWLQSPIIYAAEIERLESERFDKRKRKPDTEKLNGLFRSALKEAWETTQENLHA